MSDGPLVAIGIVIMLVGGMLFGGLLEIAKAIRERK